MEHECKPAIKSCKWDFYVAKSESNRNQRVAAVTGTQFLMKAALSSETVRNVMGISDWGDIGA